jgi:hypothetical protein
MTSLYDKSDKLYVTFIQTSSHGDSKSTPQKYKFPGVDKGSCSNIILGTEAEWDRKLIPQLHRNVLSASSG